jgi:phosphocarrier protein FPr
VLSQPEGVPAVLDGFTGTLWIGLGHDDLASAERARQDLEAVRAAEYRDRYRPAITTDGQRVLVVANVSRRGETAAAVEAGAEGVGLMRTEFLFLGRDEPPGEEEQYEVLAEMVRELGGLPLVVRTLDIGGDKNVPYLDLPAEDNSFLGVRGIRLCLTRPELFLPQLRAIYRASLLGPVEIMFPMISRVEDLEAALEYAEKARMEVGAPAVDAGIMIEVPSAAFTASLLAREVDFFTIGTNDLIQYCLAVDRADERVSRLYEPLHPAILRIILMVRRAARRHGIPVSLCGEMASDPALLTLLVGLGLTEFSMTPGAIPVAKQVLAEVRYKELRALARRVLRLATIEEIERELLGALGRLTTKP